MWNLTLVNCAALANPTSVGNLHDFRLGLNHGENLRSGRCYNRIITVWIQCMIFLCCKLLRFFEKNSENEFSSQKLWNRKTNVAISMNGHVSWFQQSENIGAISVSHPWWQKSPSVLIKRVKPKTWADDIICTHFSPNFFFSKFLFIHYSVIVWKNTRDGHSMSLDIAVISDGAWTCGLLHVLLNWNENYVIDSIYHIPYMHWSVGQTQQFA
jgi:hypothetical protein